MNVRVLLCEDYVALRELVRGACEAAGHVVVGEAAAAEEAAVLAQRTDPDVVVLDLSSCGTPADTIRPLAEAVPGSAIVAYTGLSRAAVGPGALARLAAHVSKTAPLAELVRAIEGAAYATAVAESAS